MASVPTPFARQTRLIVLPSAAHAATLAAIIVAGLYFGRSILVPLSLAVLLSFVLSPLVLVVRKSGVPRAVAVAVVVSLMMAAVGVLGMGMARQVTELANDLPRYEETLREKLKSLRTGAAQTGIVDKATATLKVLGKELDQAPPQSSTSPASTSVDAARPIAVEVHTPPERPLDTYQRIVSALLAPLTTTGIVLILIVFILLQREDIRDRFIRLVGADDIESTTTALNDAAFRLSRLFLAQTALNSAFGVVIAAGLWSIGVPSPLLWGIIAALMRFIPYVGSLLAAIFPVLLAAAVDPGWSMVLWTLALYLTVEPIVGHFIEPWLQGQTTGLSPLAIVVSAILWTALWGPIGLLLATPLTMCLVVLGRHVEGLAFLDVILGDEPALSPPEIFYQRMLAGTSAEAADQAQQILRSSSLLEYYDTVALTGLKLASRDAHRRNLDEGRMTALREGVALLVDDLSDHTLVPPADVKVDAEEGNRHEETEETTALILSKGELRPDWRGEIAPVLCLAARTPLDAATAEILAQVLRRHGISSAASSVTQLAELRGLVLDGVRVVWISSIDAAQSHAQIRYIVRRLKRSMPDLIICGGFWDGATSDALANNSGIAHRASNFSEALAVTSMLAREHPEAADVGAHSLIATNLAEPLVRAPSRAGSPPERLVHQN